MADELNLDLSQLQVYPTNQYTPALQRLLQVTANVYEATTTNTFPCVYRPLFSSDNTGTKFFITGYQQVVSVSGIADAQLAAPVEAAALTSQQTPFTNLAVNVYGIPWIIGAKKGLPNFNQLFMRNTFQITRKLQVWRSNAAIGALEPSNIVGTNQMFIMSITNRLGFSFWNSYNDDYVPTSGSVTVYMRDILSMGLTNQFGGYPTFPNVPNPALVQFAFSTNLAVWPGSAWTTYGGIPAKEQQTATPSSFVSGTWDFSFLPISVYSMASANFSDLSAPWETFPVLPQLPQFGLATTNWIQAFILDGTNVIDYVAYSKLNSTRNLNEEIRDKSSNPTQAQMIMSGTAMWDTNAYNLSYPLTRGVVNQTLVSRFYSPEAISSFWKRTPDVPATINTPQLEANYFNAFFTGISVIVNGKLYANTNLVQQAPYTPTRTAWEYTLWQANDPLVHYLDSDLNCVTRYTGLNWGDDLLSSDFPSPALNVVGDRYQSWGRNAVISQYNGVDSSAYNSRLRDPLVWSSDDWNFPTGQSWNLNWLGRVHRGTPWQTIYLKNADVLQETTNRNISIGTNTWRTWSGVSTPQDTQLTSPVSDWHLASLLGAILNTNDLRSQFSVNNPDANAWAASMDDFSVLTNTTVNPASYHSPTFDFLIISSNASQTVSIVGRIQFAHASQPFQEIGDLLAVPELTGQSPYLNWSDSNQQQYGITDEAYEAIPSQLLPLLRTDSIGSLAAANGQFQLQFTGYENHSYVVETSSDLKNWQPVSTNSPVNGSIILNLPAAGTSQFYRTLLLQ